MPSALHTLAASFRHAGLDPASMRVRLFDNAFANKRAARGPRLKAGVTVRGRMGEVQPPPNRIF